MKPYIVAVVLFVLLIASVVIQGQAKHNKSYEYVSIKCDGNCPDLQRLSADGWEIKAVIFRTALGPDWRVWLQRER